MRCSATRCGVVHARLVQLASAIPLVLVHDTAQSKRLSCTNTLVNCIEILTGVNTDDEEEEPCGDHEDLETQTIEDAAVGQRWHAAVPAAPKSTPLIASIPMGSELADVLTTCRRRLESARVKLHAEASAVAIVADRGLTEDVCHFMAVCICDALLHGAGVRSRVHDTWDVAPSPELVQMCAVVFADTAICDLTHIDLECSFGALFYHAAEIDWQAPSVRSYIAALQLQACLLVGGHLLDGDDLVDSPLRIAQWSCATARLKLRAIEAVYQAGERDRAVHAADRDAPEDIDFAQLSGGDESDEHTDAEDIEGAAVASANSRHREPIHEVFVPWLRHELNRWDSPRLREAASKARRRLDVREDEVGRNAAFGGHTLLRRSKGAMEVIDSLIHEIPQLDDIACLPDRAVLGSVRVLRDLVTMKIINNLMESVNIRFMSDMVVLDSARERAAERAREGTSLGATARIVQVNAQFEVRCDGHLTTSATGFASAFCAMYELHIGEHDPLGIWSVLRSEDDLMALQL
jgi:hypothetical protein